ncbi:MAG: hypothetical protein AABY65_03795 [Nitrospirota bacterium]
MFRSERITRIWEDYAQLRRKLLYGSIDYGKIAGYPLDLMQAMERYKGNGRFPYKALYNVRKQLPDEDCKAVERLFSFIEAFLRFKESGEAIDHTPDEFNEFLDLLHEAGDVSPR